MNNDIEAIRSCKWLFLSETGEPQDNELRLVVSEAGTGSPPSESGLAEEKSPELRKILSESRQIIHGPRMRAFEITWPTYIAYSVRNESYTTLDEYEKYEGRNFVKYSTSRYLDFVSKSTFAANDYPGPFSHWGLLCLNHIIVVVSVDEPTIIVSNDS